MANKKYKSIRVPFEIWQKLNILKYSKGYDIMEQVLIDLLEHYERRE